MLKEVVSDSVLDFSVSDSVLDFSVSEFVLGFSVSESVLGFSVSTVVEDETILPTSTRIANMFKIKRFIS